MADSTIVQVMAYINGESERADLSLAEMKEYLLSPTGVDAIYQLLQAQPECTLEQLTNMVSGTNGFILCKPPEQFLGFDLRPVYETEIRSAITLIPDEVSLLKPGQEPNKAIDELSRLRVLSRLTPIIPLVILLLITLLVVRTFKDWLTWWGIPLVLTSIPAMLVSLGAPILFSAYFDANIATEMAQNTPPSVVAAVRDVAGAIVEQALSPMLMQAFVLGAVGGVMLLIAFLINKASKNRGTKN